MRVLCVILLSPLLLTMAAAQQPAADAQSMTSYCNFVDDNQVSLQYSTSHKEEPQNGKVWMPGGSAPVLFVQTPLVLNNVQIPIGGYTVYVIPGKKTWTLIVSKNVTVGAKYDESLDLVRATLDTAQLNEPEASLHVSFVHSAPKQCSLRLDYGKIGAFGADFEEK
jgi:Protein of unknown function (DUF2911)